MIDDNTLFAYLLIIWITYQFPEVLGYTMSASCQSI